jgi:Flp pilus assembly protein TadD
VLVIVAGLYFTMGKKPAPAPVPVETTKGPVKPIGEDLIGKAQGLFDQGRVDEALQILVSIPDSDARHPEALAMIDRFKTTAIPTPSTAGPAIDLDQLKAQGLASIRSSRYIDAVKALDPVVKARPEDSEAALALAKAREEISALSSALKAYNEQDYLTAIRLLYPIYIKDKKNQDAEEFLFRSFFNDGIQKMQAGTFKDASEAFAEAAKFRPSDEEVQRHLRFTRKYPRGPEDLLSRIYVKHTAPRL